MIAIQALSLANLILRSGSAMLSKIDSIYDVGEHLSAHGELHQQARTDDGYVTMMEKEKAETLILKWMVECT